jgi:hypothetical protein
MAGRGIGTMPANTNVEIAEGRSLGMGGDSFKGIACGRSR